MNPQGGEGNNNQPPATNTAAVEPNVPPSNPLDKLEGVVAAAQEAAAAQTTPQTQFAAQFGSGQTALPVAESAPDLMGQALAGLGTTPPPSEDVPSNTQPAPEATAPPQPEVAPSDPKQKFIDTVSAAYKELKETEGKNTASS